MKTITLLKWQIEALRNGATLLVLPVEPQPEATGRWGDGPLELYAPDTGEIIPCPLGAVGERVAVCYEYMFLNYANYYEKVREQSGFSIRLTEEPVVKRVGASWRDDPKDFSEDENNAIADAGVSDAWAWFCQVEVVG